MRESNAALIADAPAGARVAYYVGLSAPRTRARAWAENPACCECGKHLEKPDHGGLVTSPHGHRVACKGACYRRALSRRVHNGEHQ